MAASSGGQPNNKNAALYRKRTPSSAASESFARALRAADYSPLHELIALAKSPSATREERIQIAGLLMPYAHAKMPSQSAVGPGVLPPIERPRDILEAITQGAITLDEGRTLLSMLKDAKQLEDLQIMADKIAELQAAVGLKPSSLPALPGQSEVLACD